MPLTNAYCKMHLNKEALQSFLWLASAWVLANKHGGMKAVWMGFFLYTLRHLVPLTNKLLAAYGREKDSETVQERVH